MRHLMWHCFVHVLTWIASVLMAIATAAAAPDPTEVTWRIRVPLGTSYDAYGRQVQSSNWGSGTAIGPACVVTNAHVVENQRVCFIEKPERGTSAWHHAKIVATDPGADLAILHVQTPHQLPFAPLAETGPTPGEQLVLLGYGSRDILRAGIGVEAGSAGVKGDAPNVRVWESTRALEKGDSGGGMFNARGELVGVNWGSDGRRSMSTAAFHLRRLLGQRGWKCTPYGCVPDVEQGQAQAGGDGWQPHNNGGGMSGQLVPVTPGRPVLPGPIVGPSQPQVPPTPPTINPARPDIDLSPYATKAELGDAVTRLEGLLGNAKGTAGGLGKIGAWVSGLSPSGFAIAGALGLTGLPAVGVGIGYWLVKRRLRKAIEGGHLGRGRPGDGFRVYDEPNPNRSRFAA